MNIRYPPLVLLSQRALVLKNGSREDWVDLSRLRTNAALSHVSADMDKENELSGTVKAMYRRSLACNYCEELAKTEGGGYKAKIGSYEAIRIMDFKEDGADVMALDATETFSFTKKVDTGVELIYLDPKWFPHVMKNLFTSLKRMFPVKFEFPYPYVMAYTFKVPEDCNMRSSAI